MKTNQLKVKEGRTELTLVHNGENLTFIYPCFGPDTYANVNDLIEEAKLERPTMSQTASLVHAAFNSDDKYSTEIKELLKKRWLWTFTGILYVPNEGAYIQDKPRIKDRMPFIEKSELVKKLEQNDHSVRFVPFGFKTESMKPSELAKNKFVVGLAGEEGAEKLAEISDKFKNDPFLWGFKSVDETITRVSALGSYWGSVRGLLVDGYDHGYYRGGYAFGYAPKNSTGNKPLKKKLY